MFGVRYQNSKHFKHTKVSMTGSVTKISASVMFEAHICNKKLITPLLTIQTRY